MRGFIIDVNLWIFVGLVLMDAVFSGQMVGIGGVKFGILTCALYF